MKYQSKFWEKYFKIYDILLDVIPYQDLMKSIARNLQISKGQKVLDLGAGTGNIQYFIDGAQVHSIDNSQEALAQLATKFGKEYSVKGSITERLPYADNTFDRVVSNNVLYTLPKHQWPSVISEIRRVCKPGGIVVVSNLNASFNAFKIYRQHVKQSIAIYGWAATMTKSLRLIKPTIEMFMYNKTISENNKSGNYSFVRENEQRQFFELFGFNCLASSQHVYADQAVLNSFQKV